jgi:signal transduction histidine kinase
LQARPDTVLHFERLSLEPIVHAAVADSRMVAGSDAPAVEVSVEPALPPVQGDRDALAMVIKNLIMNALKHGAGSPVRVTIRTRRSAGGRDVVLAVQDHGPGIPSDELARIFQPFFRGRGARNGLIDGTGIGLSLVRQAVQSHGGRVHVSSAPHRGTTFTLQIPALARTTEASRVLPIETDPARR